jgi:hypothetical protein
VNVFANKLKNLLLPKNLSETDKYFGGMYQYNQFHFIPIGKKNSSPNQICFWWDCNQKKIEGLAIVKKNYLDTLNLEKKIKYKPTTDAICQYLKKFYQ